MLSRDKKDMMRPNLEMKTTMSEVTNTLGGYNRQVRHTENVGNLTSGLATIQIETQKKT